MTIHNVEANSSNEHVDAGLMTYISADEIAGIINNNLSKEQLNNSIPALAESLKQSLIEGDHIKVQNILDEFAVIARTTIDELQIDPKDTEKLKTLLLAYKAVADDTSVQYIRGEVRLAREQRRDKEIIGQTRDIQAEISRVESVEVPYQSKRLANQDNSTLTAERVFEVSGTVAILPTDQKINGIGIDNSGSMSPEAIKELLLGVTGLVYQGRIDNETDVSVINQIPDLTQENYNIKNLYNLSSKLSTKPLTLYAPELGKKGEGCTPLYASLIELLLDDSVDHVAVLTDGGSDLAANKQFGPIERSEEKHIELIAQLAKALNKKITFVQFNAHDEYKIRVHNFVERLQDELGDDFTYIQHNNLTDALKQLSPKQSYPSIQTLHISLPSKPQLAQESIRTPIIRKPIEGDETVGKVNLSRNATLPDTTHEGPIVFYDNGVATVPYEELGISAEEAHSIKITLYYIEKQHLRVHQEAVDIDPKKQTVRPYLDASKSMRLNKNIIKGLLGSFAEINSEQLRVSYFNTFSDVRRSRHTAEAHETLSASKALSNEYLEDGKGLTPGYAAILGLFMEGFLNHKMENNMNRETKTLGGRDIDNSNSRVRSKEISEAKHAYRTEVYTHLNSLFAGFQTPPPSIPLPKLETSGRGEHKRTTCIMPDWNVEGHLKTITKENIKASDEKLHNHLMGLENTTLQFRSDAIFTGARSDYRTAAFYQISPIISKLFNEYNIHIDLVHIVDEGAPPDRKTFYTINNGERGKYKGGQFVMDLVEATGGGYHQIVKSRDEETLQANIQKIIEAGKPHLESEPEVSISNPTFSGPQRIKVVAGDKELILPIVSSMSPVTTSRDD